MDLNGTEATSNSPANTRSVFSCPYAPNLLWDLNGTTFSWVLIGITAITSPATIILNISVIIAVTQRKELQKRSNILLSSLAVADLLVGALNMPLSAALSYLIVREIWLEHICMLDILNVYSMYCFSMCSLYHLTAIAWDRYVAVVKWMDYKVIVTKSRVKKLAITAWLLAIFTTVPVLIMEMIGVDVKISEKLYYVWCILRVIAVVLIIYFYVRVYLGVRKRKISNISNVTFLIMAKIESKVAKTGAMLCGALVFSFVPSVVMYILGEVFPVLHTSTSFLVWEMLIHFNSLVNPILYCGRHRQFRNAVLELSRLRKPLATQATVGPLRHAIRKDLSRAKDLKLDDVANPPCPTRAESCDLAVDSYRFHGMGSSEIMLKRSTSALTLIECRSPSSIDDFQPQQPLSIMLTTAIIHAEDGQRGQMKTNIPELPNDVDLSQGTANIVRNTVRPKSCDARTSVEFAECCPDVGDTVSQRPWTAPYMHAESTLNLCWTK